MLANAEEKVSSTVPETVKSHRRSWTAYFWCLFLIPIIGYIAPFLLERIPQISRITASYMGGLEDYNFNLRGVNADIILFGDSSVLFGVDTQRLSKEVGRRAINLPNTWGMLPTTGDFLLRHYLSINRPPQLIVFYFTPWTLDYSAARGGTYEGDEFLMRHGSLQDILRLARTKPHHLLLFPFRFYLTPSKLTSLITHDIPPWVVRDGFVPYPPGTPAGDQSCSLPAYYLERTSTKSTRELLARYSSLETKTVVYVAPIPDCRNAGLFLKERYKGWIPPSPAILPARYFANDPALIHPLPRYVPVTTDLLAAAIKRNLPE